MFEKGPSNKELLEKISKMEEDAALKDEAQGKYQMAGGGALTGDALEDATQRIREHKIALAKAAEEAIRAAEHAEMLKKMRKAHICSLVESGAVIVRVKGKRLSKLSPDLDEIKKCPHCGASSDGGVEELLTRVSGMIQYLESKDGRTDRTAFFVEGGSNGLIGMTGGMAAYIQRNCRMCMDSGPEVMSVQVLL